MNITKIVFLGAGSMSFGLSMFKDIFSSTELSGSTLTLVDTNRVNLDRMTQLAGMMKQLSHTALKIESAPDRRSALDGAEFII